MKTYTYLAPKIKTSTKLVEVIHENGDRAFTFQRNYKNGGMRLADFFLGKDIFVQYNVFNNNDELYYFGLKIPRWSKSQYIIKNQKTSKEYHISYIGSHHFAPDLLVKSDETQMIIKQTHSDWIKFYYNELEVARWKMKTSELFKAYLEIESHSPIQEPEFFTCICQCIFYIGN